MRLRTTWLGLSVMGMGLLVSGLARAQTIEERIKIIEDKIVERQQALPIDMHALLMTDFNWDFNNPPGNIPLQTFNYKSNTFTLRDAALFLSRQREDEAFGFGLTLDFGDTANAIKARWAAGPDGANENICGNTGDCFFEVREAYLTYKTPLTVPTSETPISLKAGKFVTLLGYEVIPTYSNFNPNISTDLLFGFSIPFTHTGLMGHFPIIEQVALDLGVVNGWDNVDDNNNSKTLLGGLGITPIDPVVIYISGTYGGESNPIADGGAGAGSKRGVLSANATWKVIDQLQLIIDGTWAQETNTNRAASFASTGQRITANWYGLAGYVVTQPMEKLQVALRAEWFDDPDGTQTGVDQTLWDITPTLTYNLTDHLVFRTEYRHDESNKQFFQTGSNAFVRGQDLVFSEFIVAF